ncbi:hypothetical protein NDAWWUGD_CDS0172 [Salmonella phage SeKF_80]
MDRPRLIRFKVYPKHTTTSRRRVQELEGTTLAGIS